MSRLAFDPTERRVLGTLIEKTLLGSDDGVLTLNQLLNGCNQLQNRDPVREHEAFEVDGALRSLRTEGWVVERDTMGGRTQRYRERLTEELGLSKPERALLAELFLRGAQQPGKLRVNARRMAPIDDLPALKGHLRALGERTPPLVRELERAPGERSARWADTLQEASMQEQSGSPDRGSSPELPMPSPVSDEAGLPTTPATQLASEEASTDALEARVAALEQEMEAVRTELRRFRDALGD